LFENLSPATAVTNRTPRHLFKAYVTMAAADLEHRAIAPAKPQPDIDPAAEMVVLIDGAYIRAAPVYQARQSCSCCRVWDRRRHDAMADQTDPIRSLLDVPVPHRAATLWLGFVDLLQTLRSGRAGWPAIPWPPLASGLETRNTLCLSV
jgi:hypothetical protein